MMISKAVWVWSRLNWPSVLLSDVQPQQNLSLKKARCVQFPPLYLWNGVSSWSYCTRSLNPAVPPSLLPAQNQPHLPRLIALTVYFSGHSEAMVPHNPPPLVLRLLNVMCAAAFGGRGGLSLESVSPWTPAPIFASSSSSSLAVCSCLSPAPCYKVSVICGVKCRPQTEGQLKVRQQRHPVPPGPAAHRKQGCAGSPLSGSGACLGPQRRH